MGGGRAQDAQAPPRGAPGGGRSCCCSLRPPGSFGNNDRGDGNWGYNFLQHQRAQLLVVRIELEIQRERLAEVGDRADVAEDVGETVVEEPAERLPLDGDQVGDLEDLRQIAERVPVPDEGASRHLKLLARMNGR